MPTTCPDCRGKGTIQLLASAVPCKTCGGKGQLDAFAEVLKKGGIEAVAGSVTDAGYIGVARERVFAMQPEKVDWTTPAESYRVAREKYLSPSWHGEERDLRPNVHLVFVDQEKYRALFKAASLKVGQEFLLSGGSNFDSILDEARKILGASFPDEYRSGDQVHIVIEKFVERDAQKAVAAVHHKYKQLYKLHSEDYFRLTLALATLESIANPAADANVFQLKNRARNELLRQHHYCSLRSRTGEALVVADRSPSGSSELQINGQKIPAGAEVHWDAATSMLTVKPAK